MPQFPPIQTLRCLAKTTCRLAVALAFLSASIATALAQTNPPVITSPTNDIATVGTPYSYFITASGNPTGYGGNNFPPGFVNPQSNTNGIITGLPQAVGVFSSTITAVNVGGTSATNLFIAVNPPEKPVLASPTTFFGVQGQPLNYPLYSTPNHSNVPTTFSASGLGAFGGFLTSSVTANSSYPDILVTNYFIKASTLSANGSFVVPVVVRNQGGTNTNNVTFIINPTNAPAFTSANAATGAVGVPFSFDITAINSPFAIMVTNMAVGTYATNPFTGVITTNFGTPVATGFLLNGALTNGLYFTNVSVGGSTVGRVFGSPGAAYAVRLGLFATNNVGGASGTLTIAVQSPQPTIVLSQPLGEANYVAGSSFYVNAQVFDQLPDIIVPSSVGFRAGNAGLGTNTLPGSVGRLGDFYGINFDPSFPPSSDTDPVALANSRFSLEATGRNNLGSANVSVVLGMIAAPPQNAIPQISMLPLNPGPSVQAGGSVILRAQASIPSTRVSIDRVEFYVNKVYVGFANAPVAGTTDEYNFTWKTPATAGSYEISARAVSLNYTTPALGPPFGLPGQTQFWASIITRTPVALNTLSGTPPTVTIAPISNNGQLTLGVANRIQASASLTGGAIQSVEFYANGQLIPSLASTGGTPNPDPQAPFEVDFIPNSVGSYEIFAIATGSNGLKTVSPVVVAKVPGGREPAVSIVSPLDNSTIYTGESQTIVANASDADGVITKVELLVNGVLTGTATAAPYIFLNSPNFTGDVTTEPSSFTPRSVGLYTVQLRATDNSGNATLSPAITLPSKNPPAGERPFVLMTQPNQTRYVFGSSMFLNARATATTGGGRISNTSSVNFTVNGLANGLIPPVGRVGNDFGIPFVPETQTLYVATAYATNAAGVPGQSAPLYLPDSFTPFPAPETPMPSVIVDTNTTLAPGAPINPGGTVTLQAKAVIPVSQFSQSATNDQYVEFYANNVFIGRATNTSTNSIPGTESIWSYNWVTPGPNTAEPSYKIQARVVALNFNVRVSSNSVIPYYSSVVSEGFVVLNTGDTAAPVVSITRPTNNAQINTGVPTLISAQASLPPGQAGSIDRVEFYANGQLIPGTTIYPNPDTKAPYNVEFTPPSPGIYNINAVAVSGTGVQTISDVIKISTVSGAAPTVALTAPLEGAYIPVSTPVRVTANAFDPDGSVTSVTFRANGLPIVPFGASNSVTPGGTNSSTGANVNPDTAAPYQVDFVAPSPGRYVLDALAIDNSLNETLSAPVTVFVAGTSELTAKVTAPIEGANYTTGSPVILAADATTTIGNIVSVQFFVNGQAVVGTTTTPNPATQAPYVINYTPPGVGPYEVYVVATDSNGNTKRSDVVNFEVSPPVGSAPVIYFSAPLQDGRYFAAGSRVYLNYTVVDPEGAIKPESVKIYVNNIAQLGVQQIGPDGLSFGVPFTLSTQGIYSISAEVQDADGNTAFSGVTQLEAQPARRNFPTFDDFSVSSDYPDLAVGVPVTISAKPRFPTVVSTNLPGQVEFYGNGVLLGEGITSTNNPGYYDLEWIPEISSPNIDFTARAFTENFVVTTILGNTTIRDIYSGSAVSAAIAGGPIKETPTFPPDDPSNEAFVANVYEALLYEPPTYPVWEANVAALNAGRIDRATYVMSLMGYDSKTLIFNRNLEYGRGAFVAFSTFARLELTPTDGLITSFLRTLESDLRLLPYAATFAPQAPWGATYGMAKAMKSVFTGNEFRVLYPQVTSFDNQSFVLWLSTDMFKGQSMADNDPMFALMSTPSLASDRFLRFGAAAAVMNQFSTFALSSSVYGYIYDYYGTPIEKTFERRLGTAALQLQLGGEWPSDFSKVPYFSKTAVQNILNAYVPGGAGAAASASGARGQARSYQGIFGDAEASAGGSAERLVTTSSTVPARVRGGLKVVTTGTTGGTYSAALTLDNGTIYRAKGSLKTGGVIKDTWGPGLSVELRPVETDGAKYLGGTIKRGATVDTVVAGRQLFSTQSPLRAAGSYSLILRLDPAPTSKARLQGTGFASVKTSSSGTAKVVGRLADNMPFTATVPVWGATGVEGEDGLLLHSPLYKGMGALGGWIFMGAQGEGGGGQLDWQAPSSVLGGPIDTAIQADLQPYRAVSGSGSVLPVSWLGQRMPFGLQWLNGSAAKTISGNLTALPPASLLGESNGLSLKLVPSTGLLSGSFIENGQKYKVQGILDQVNLTIEGFFLTPSSSGILKVNP